MPKLELEHCNPFPEDGSGWYAGRMPDGRRVHAAPTTCAAGNLHWSGSVEDPDRCDCNQTEGSCAFCQIRQQGGLIFTKVTGCYRSANSAVRALQQWAANPGSPPPPAPWHCPWDAMQALPCENVPKAPPLPLPTGMLTNGRPANSLTMAAEGGYDAPPSSPALPETAVATADLCANDHAQLKYGWALLDAAPTICPQCGQTPIFLEIAITADPEISDHYGLPEQVSRQWLTEHSEPDVFGDVRIPDERRRGLFTAVRYAPDCSHAEPCDCWDNDAIMWVLEDYVARDLDATGTIA